MKLQRHGLVAGLVVGVLALSACGSDNTGNSGSGSGSGGASGSASGSTNCFSGTLNGAGSSAQNPAVTAWIQAFQAKCGGASVNYTAQGSGNGRTQFIQKQVPWAGSDAALKEEQKTQADARCSGGKAIDLPMVITPVAIAYNVSGVDKLTLTPSTIAQIFNNKITSWNDPAIAKSNPGVQLPSKTITPVHRSSDSGTTENFTNFLAAQAPTDWPYKPAQAWPAQGGQGASNSAALVSQVKGTDGAIGYVDNPDATKNQLKTVSVDTGNGGVAISEDSVSKAIESAKATDKDGDITLKINYGLKEAGAYPAILATYQITCTAGLPQDQATAVKSWLSYISSDEGQQQLTPIGHFPLPQALRKQVQNQVAKLSAS